MKFNYTFSNLCGTVYKGGNLVFTPDGDSILRYKNTPVPYPPQLKSISYILYRKQLIAIVT